MIKIKRFMASMTFILILITFKEIFSFYFVPNLQGRYNGRILGKKSEIRPNALFWSEFGGIFRSLEKFGGI